MAKAGSARGLEAWLAAAASADLRALAATRIAVGLLLLYDLLTRLCDLHAHYTDAGVVPLALLPETPLFGNRVLSLHALAAGGLAQGLLFAAALLCAGALVAGFHTRRASWASWALLISLHARNPHVLYEADVMLGLLLVWGALLPWGARWSLDARGRPAPPLAVRSPAVLGIRLQLASALLVAYLAKTGPTWSDGRAVAQVLSLDVYATGFGRWLRGFPELLRLLTRATLWVELLGPLLVFLPGRGRWLGIALLAGLQLGFGSALHLGIFPWVFLVGLLPFVPTRAPRVVERRLWVGPLAAALILLSAADNAAYLVPRLRQGALTWVARTLHADQGWGMFAPDPRTDDLWFVLPGRLSDGREVDLLSQRPLGWDKPPDVSGSFGGDRWTELLMAAEEESDQPVLERVLAHFAARWDRTHPTTPVRHARLVAVHEASLPDGSEGAPTQEVLARWRRP
ncbi:MAG: hypothetical protein R3F62_17990 [Planctomycetota bacterium]